MIDEVNNAEARPLSEEDIWGIPIQQADQPAGWGTDHYRCPECGSFTPGLHHRDCQMWRHSA
jgi:hypothetical protein